MKSFIVIASLAVLASFSPTALGVDSRIVLVRLPNEDVEARYVEKSPTFTVALRAKSGSVEGVNFYVGDGGVAVELKAHSSNGLFFQGKKIEHGYVFKKGSTVKVLPGYKRLSDLDPGTVYVELPGVTFEVPEKK